ncbi:hypothetical protein QPX54_07605 [Corynebacterium propinquum]|uniref:Uncharacterized protein n=1 Tax=Corynebacterium propinquum TaxID=43769 RepID=A0AAP4FB70_9CORY|nr:hypothetical protein [Corynebacterium propinquum]MDK4326366.1 hypothetical protein [Corynebacterium propinquum]
MIDSAGLPAMPHARPLPTVLKLFTTADAVGMVSPVDFENYIGLTTSRKEIAA